MWAEIIAWYSQRFLERTKETGGEFGVSPVHTLYERGLIPSELQDDSHLLARSHNTYMYIVMVAVGSNGYIVMVAVNNTICPV